MTDTAVALRHRFVENLREAGALTDPAWVEAFGSVAREDFCPAFGIRGRDGTMTTMDCTHPEWLETVYSDRALVVVGSDLDGHPLATSSQPSVMAAMLQALDVDDDSTVLEVGCGTGYNAALLSARLPGKAVVTMEKDPVLAASAAEALTAAAFDARVEVGDAFTHPPGGTFDRIIVTCNPGRVPVPLIEALGQDGVAVIPIGSIVAVLTKSGESLTGRVLGSEASFTPDVALDLAVTTTEDDGEWRRQPTKLWDEAFDPQLRTLASLLFPYAVHFWDTDTGQYLLDDRCGSVAKVDRDSRAVHHRGPRNLWSEFEALASRWRAAGRPMRGQWHLAVDAHGAMTATIDGSALM